MGFLDKAKAAANDLAVKADTAMANSGLSGPGGASSGQPDRFFRDLGVLAYLEATERPEPEGERERLMSSLREAESRGSIPSFALQTSGSAPGSVPPPPGAAARASAPPPPPTAEASPMPRPDSPATYTPPPPPPGPTPAPSSAPPPPPSWAAGGDSGSA